MQKKKYTILIDLDGVLNLYDGTNYDEKKIPPARTGVIEFLENITTRDVELVLFTSRPQDLALQWLKDNKLDHFFAAVTNTKKPAWIIIDDRCICFDGNYNNLLNNIDSFKPCYKRKTSN